MAAATASQALGGLASPASSAGAPPLPESAAEALMACLQSAQHPLLAGPGGRRFAVGILQDLRMLLVCGRPAAVCALTDLRRLLQAALRELPAPLRRPSPASCGQGSSLAAVGEVTMPASLAAAARGAAVPSSSRSGREGSAADKSRSTGRRPPSEGPLRSSGDSGSRSSASGSSSGLRRRLQATERKLAYFQSWANEQPRELYKIIAEAVSQEERAHSESLQASAALTAGSKEAAATLSNSNMPCRSVACAAQHSNQWPGKLVQELEPEQLCSEEPERSITEFDSRAADSSNAAPSFSSKACTAPLSGEPGPHANPNLLVGSLQRHLQLNGSGKERAANVQKAKETTKLVEEL